MSEENHVRDTFDRLVSGRSRTVTTPGAPPSAEDMPVVVLDDIDTSSLRAEHVERLKIQPIALTEKTANWVFNCEPVPGERPMRDDHVSVLATAMTRGSFLAEVVMLAVCHCEADNKIYRINGQHTSWARITLDSTTYNPVVNLGIYRAKTMAGVRALYAQFDRGATRTRSNLVESYLADAPPFDKYGRALRAALASGVGFYAWPKNHDRTRHDADSVVSLMTGVHKDAVVHAASILNTPTAKESQHIRRAATVAAIMATYYVAPKPSSEFWLKVRDGTDMTEKDDPRLKLRNELLTRAVGSASNRRSKENAPLSNEMTYRYCVSMWNAWREKRSVSRMPGTKGADRPTPK